MGPMSSSVSSVFCLILLLLPRPAFSGSAVPSLPGFPGLLPFTLETGYISVGDVEFFYWFVESESNPRADPLLLYINGGPGCSGFNGFIYQIGPLKFNITDYVGGLPTLINEPNTWSKTANLLFLDAPVGAGFSYATTDEGYYTTDATNADQIHHFLRNWLSEHPKFITNRVYLGSDSYAGITIPILATYIITGNAAGLQPQIRLEGYSLGCPHTFADLETNSRIHYAHRLALISDGLYESAKNSCGGNYATPTGSAKCTVDLAAITECTQLINQANTVEPYCAFIKPDESNNLAAFQLISPNQDTHRRALHQLTYKHNNNYIHSSNSHKPDLWCKNIDYLLSDFWLNDADVQTALHIRNGTKGEVYRCNSTLSGYAGDITNVVAYHQNLTAIGLQVLVFSGDHDMMIPHIAMETWIKYLGLDIESDWRPWFVDGQVAGYTRKYSETGYRLTYATLKGSGHSPTEYKRKECYHMFDRWIHYYPL